MKKTKEPMHDTLDQGEDFGAFEEWEEGKAPESVQTNKPVEEDLSQKEAPKRAVKSKAILPDAPQKTAAGEIADELIDLAPDVPVNLVAVIGKTATNVGELIKYRIGQVIDLGRAPGETVDLVANGRLIARGELVEMDGKMGVRILKMVR